jgi:hypothetical protein
MLRELPNQGCLHRCVSSLSADRHLRGVPACRTTAASFIRPSPLRGRRRYTPTGVYLRRPRVGRAKVSLLPEGVPNGRRKSSFSSRECVRLRNHVAAALARRPLLNEVDRAACDVIGALA